MTYDAFWTLVGRVHQQSFGDMQMKCELLGHELRKLPAGEVASFAQHFGECFRKADTWDLWGAAFVMGDGCGDDSFMDFRSRLISFGRDVFERALADPETLADLDLRAGDEMQWEGYQYVSNRIYRELTGAELPLPIHPYQEPVGLRFDKRAMSHRYPRLVAKYGYDESKW